MSTAQEAVAALSRMKPMDDRPAKGAWAPGGYLCLCMDCEEHFLGDKRALHCADCAYSR